VPQFLSIEVFGDKVVQRKLFRGAERAGNMRPALWKVREDMFRVIRATFLGQGRRYGGSWKALSPATVAAKERAGLDPRILIARERLMNSLTVRGNRNMRSSVTRDKINLTSTLEYAEAQNFGTADGHVPQRQFIKFYPQDRARWIKICEESLMEAMRA
jgi:phage gpG-like protein